MLRTARQLLAVLLLGSPAGAWAANCGESMVTNACLRADNPVEACGELVASNPSSVGSRIALCEALALEGKLDAAEVVIAQGISRCSGRACQSLRLAMSYLEERRVARDREDPRAAERNRLANRRFCLAPFSNERAVSACETLLLGAPKDTEVYAALIEKLLEMGDASGALAYAIQGRKQIGDAALFSELVAQAADERKAVVDDCLTDTSFEKCEQAYLAGADDEYLVLRRQGELLTEAGQYEQAEEALQSAAQLAPAEPSIRQALAALDTARNPQPPPLDPPTQTAVSVAQNNDAAAAAPATEPDEVAAPVTVMRNLISANGTSF